MIEVFKSDSQNDKFYSLIGRYFASLDIAKELERQVYNKPNSIWYVSQNGGVKGFAALFDNGKYYFLDNLYVLPEFRNSGTAKEIVQQMVLDNTDKPIRCIANNPYALKIFQQLGFKEVGQNGKYKKLIKHCAEILPI